MKAKINFLRLDNEKDESELVFDIIPNSGDGVYCTNRWLVRVAQCFVDSSAGGGSDNLSDQIKLAKQQIGVVMDITE